jgi:CheY-like chemotaxis protein
MHPSKPRVALLEDHQDTRELLQVALDKHFSILDYENASDLLTALETEKFSAIIADIMLPGLDGYSFIKTLRSDPRFQNLCVIAVTALAMATQRQRYSR